MMIVPKRDKLATLEAAMRVFCQFVAFFTGSKETKTELNTLYWHDYETWGADPSVDRPCQFAGVRTDEALNIVGEPLVLYCRPPADILPQPEACLVTGITPQEAERKGVSEREFIRQVHAQMAEPHTCTVGYNSIRFDDEVTRYCLYRNYYDPYEREWKNGNSRWDIIDMLRLCYALRPKGIEWPLIDDKPSFKLEYLSVANGISHDSAHDAYADVDATIKLARLVKQKQSRLYDYVYEHRLKTKVAALIDLQQCKPLLHISSRYPAERGCAALIAPLAMHPVNRNAVIVCDLSFEPSALQNLTAEDIHARVFTAQADLLEGQQRIPLKLVHLNKSPILATPKLLDDTAAKRLGIDKAQCERHWQKIKTIIKTMDLQNKLLSVFSRDDFPPRKDPERQLYDGFIGDRDKRTMFTLREAEGEELAAKNFVFDDRRLNGMLLAYKARNFPESLSPAEQHEWQDVLQQRWQQGDEGILSVDAYLQRIGELQVQYAEEPEKLRILQRLQAYVS